MENIPESVRRQSEEADRLMQEYVARRNPQTQPQEEPEEPEEQEQKTQELEGSVNGSQEPAPPAREDSELELWKQRYRTLQGKYNAEIGHANRRVSELEGQIQQLSSQLEELKNRRTEPDPELQKPLVRPEDVENFGSDMVDFVRRAVQEGMRAERAEYQKKIQELEARNAKLEATLAGVEEKTGQTAVQAFLQQLDALVSDWRALNTDPAFLLWLEEEHELTGTPRRVLLQAAEQSLDAKRVAAFFNAFKKETGRVAPPPTPNSQTRQASPEVARQVQPGKSKAATTPASEPAKKIWTEREIAQFYENAKLGRYSREDQARIEAEIDLAVAEGRIRP